MDENRTVKKFSVSASLDKLYFYELVVGVPMCAIFGIAALCGLLDMVPVPIATIGIILFTIGLALTADSALIFIVRHRDKKKDKDKGIVVYEDTFDVEIRTTDSSDAGIIPFNRLIRIYRGEFGYGNFLGAIVGARRNVGFVKIVYTDTNDKEAFKNFGPIEKRSEFIKEMNRLINEAKDKNN